MSPRDRLHQLAWPAFRQLAVQVLGRQDAAALLRECADVLEAEQRIADERARAESNIVRLPVMER